MNTTYVFGNFLALYFIVLLNIYSKITETGSSRHMTVIIYREYETREPTPRKVRPTKRNLRFTVNFSEF